MWITLLLMRWLLWRRNTVKPIQEAYEVHVFYSNMINRFLFVIRVLTDLSCWGHDADNCKCGAYCNDFKNVVTLAKTPNQSLSLRIT